MEEPGEGARCLSHLSDCLFESNGVSRRIEYDSDSTWYLTS